MAIAIATNDTLAAIADARYPSTGTIGYVALLKADLATNLAATPSSGADTLTTSAHGLVTGSRVRIASTGTLPAPLTSDTDYFAIVDSTTVFRLANTADDAVAGTAIDLTDAGSGAITINEQVLLPSDANSVLINKEITHPAWTARAAINNIGAAIVGSGQAFKPAYTININNTDTTNLTYKHILIIDGGTPTIGSATSITGTYLTTEATPVSIISGETKTLVLNIKVTPQV